MKPKDDKPVKKITKASDMSQSSAYTTQHKTPPNTAKQPKEQPSALDLKDQQAKEAWDRQIAEAITKEKTMPTLKPEEVAGDVMLAEAKKSVSGYEAKRQYAGALLRQLHETRDASLMKVIENKLIGLKDGSSPPTDPTELDPTALSMPLSNIPPRMAAVMGKLTAGTDAFPGSVEGNVQLTVAGVNADDPDINVTLDAGEIAKDWAEILATETQTHREPKEVEKLQNWGGAADWQLKFIKETLSRTQIHDGNPDSDSNHDRKKKIDSDSNHDPNS